MALIDRVKYDARSSDVIVWKFPSEELRIGTQVIVNEAQEAILFKEGRALDVFGPGRHTLATDNIPLVRKLVNAPFGGKTPFTAEVWYVNKTARRGLKWGTSSRIPVMDPKFGFPVSLGAFGEWGLRIEDSRSFLTQLVGTVFDSRTGSSQGEAALTEKIEDYFAAEISQRFSSAVAQMAVKQGISVFEINVYLNELAEFTAEQIRPEFERFGIEIVHFNVERVNIPEEEQKKFQEVLGRKMEIEQISQAKVGEAYATMRTFDTLEKAAESDGGAGGIIASGLGLGIGVGAGVPLGQKMGGAMNTDPAPQTEDDPVARLRQLKQMFDEGLITEEQFEAKKEEVLKQM